MRKRLVVVLALVAAAITAQPAAAETACPEIQVIGVPGTHYHLSFPPPGLPRVDFNQPGAMITNVKEKLAPEQASGRLAYEQVAYPADIGVAMSYRDSTRWGATVAKRRIAEIAARCGQTRFAIIGYSQGAAIAGDVLHDIGAGLGPISASRVSNGVLFADPRRTAADVFVGPPVVGVGVDDPRPGGFGDLHGKTVTFCAAGDLVCDNNPNTTILRPLVRRYAGTSNLTFIETVIRALVANGIDLQKWAQYVDEPNPAVLLAKVAGTAQQVEAYNRLGTHGFYNDLRLDIGGKTATDIAADRIRNELFQED